MVFCLDQNKKNVFLKIMKKPELGLQLEYAWFGFLVCLLSSAYFDGSDLWRKDEKI